MKRSAIRNFIRGIIADPVRAAGGSENDTRCLWKNVELDLYIQEAVDEIARRCLLLTDSLTDEVCRIAMDPTKQHYQLDPRILSIEEVYPSWGDDPLPRSSRETIGGGAWLKATGRPGAYLTDYASGYLSFDRKPTVDTDYVRLAVTRMPLLDLASDNDEPEFSRDYHGRVYNWILYRCYMKHDSETFNGEKAGNYRFLFEGPEPGGRGGDIGAIMVAENAKKPIIRQSQRSRSC